MSAAPLSEQSSAASSAIDQTQDRESTEDVVDNQWLK